MGERLTAARQRMHDAAAAVGIDEEVVARLDYPRETLACSIPLRRDDGSLLHLKAWRCRYDSTLGPTKGGIRFHPSVHADEVQTLAFLMTMKCALAGLPYGGGKGGVSVDTRTLSYAERERVARGYVRAIASLLGPDRDIPAPDVATGETEMAWMVDEYSELVRRLEPACFTGKPVSLGGIAGRTPATGRGGYEVFKNVRAKLGLGDGPIRMAVQGFGNAAIWFARAAAADGHTIVAAADSRGLTANSDGLDLDALIALKEAGGKLADFTGGTKGESAAILGHDCDLLVLAALEDAVTAANVGDLKARAILELANAPVAPDADAGLRERGIAVVPDILANAGGVTISHAEWCQNREGLAWSSARVSQRLVDVMREASEAVVAAMTTHRLDMRTAAYVVALQRVCAGITARGTAASFRAGR